MSNFTKDSDNTAKFENNAVTTLAEGIETDTTTFNVTDAAVFPTVNGSGTYFMATLVKADGTREVIKVTDTSAAPQITCVRAQEGTIAVTFDSADIISHRLTAGVLEDMMDDIANANDDIDDLETQVATNVTNIGTPAGTDNASDIAINTAAIAALRSNDRILVVEEGERTALKYSSWETCNLTTLEVDEGSHASLDSEILTLEKGIYDVTIIAPCYVYLTTGDYIATQVRLYDITNSATIAEGTYAQIPAETYNMCYSICKARITVAADNTEVRVEQYAYSNVMGTPGVTTLAYNGASTAEMGLQLEMFWRSAT